ncbi:MAG: cell division protein ZapB, partial [Candidatus Zixiibacteriota bacterium]
MNVKLAAVLLLALALPLTGAAQDEAVVSDTAVVDSVPPPRPPSNLEAFDSPNDHGHSITLRWDLSADDGAGANNAALYEILRWTPFFMDTVKAIRDSLTLTKARIAELKQDLPETKQQLRESQRELKRLRKKRNQLIGRIPKAYAGYPQYGEWRVIDTAFKGQDTLRDLGVKEKESTDYMADHTDYYYRVDVLTTVPGIGASSQVFGPVQSYGQWYNTYRSPVLIAVLVFGFLTIFFVSWAKKGAELYVRPLAGIDAVDDAIGRATEMGKPILYVLGLGTAADIATIASFTILGRVARRVAEYQTDLIVPCYDPIVMTVAQETVKGGYSDAGRPEAYTDDIVYFVTQSQFAYVAAVNGTMLRQLPATNVYMGK